MVGSLFDGILKDFEAFFNCPLEADANDSCLIKMPNGLSIQLELNSYGLLMIGCKLGALKMGRFRELAIKEALKANENALPATGFFGFSQKSQNLILFIQVDPKILNADKITSLMIAFTSKAKLWLDAISKEEIPSSLTSSTLPTSSFGLFGR